MNDMSGKPQYRVVGTRPVRPDGIDKVTGKAVFSADHFVAGMIYGAILRSPHAHARIRSIDTSKAAALPGVKAVVTGADFPALKSMEVDLGEGGGDIVDMSVNCMARDKVFYDGHAVAAVAATSASIAAEALELITVDYEVLPHVTDLAAAMADDAPVLHARMRTKGLDTPSDKPTNVSMRFVMEKGDVAAGLARAKVVARGSFSSAPVHQGYLEPQACTVAYNSDGQVQIWASSQGAFMIRTVTAQVLNLPIADIRVTPLEIGGGFGGKTVIYLEPVAVLLSKKSGRPVRLAMSRSDVFRATGPAPGTICDVAIGCDENGIITGAEVTFSGSAGAFPGSGTHPAAVCSLAPYKIPDYRIVGHDVVTNMACTAAYRSPGAPPIIFAVESIVDELAGKLGMDPIDLRLRNAIQEGDPSPSGVPFGPIGLKEMLEAAKVHPHWSEPLEANQGRGIAAGYWPNFGGQSTASVSLTDDGTVIVTTGSPDIGGSRASMAMMAAEVIGLPYDSVRATVADTSSIGYSMLTGGSRTTFATGKAVVEATEKVVDGLKARAASIWGVDAGAVEWAGGEARCTAQDKEGTLSVRELCGKGGPISAEATVNPPDPGPGIAVQIVDVEVDPDTGTVTVLRVTALQDVGRAIHPSYVEGQMQGGVVQGIGWALNEGYVFNAKGQLDNAGFLDYRIPVASDLPMISTVMIEVPWPSHPFGVKGVGEAPICPPMGAVANAVSAATGVRMHHLPMSPDRILTEVAAAQ